MTFKELGLIDPILQALDKQGYTQPTPIQQQAIPIVLENTDLIACAQTGTGKTAAFAIPIIQNLVNGNGGNTQIDSKQKLVIEVLVLTPTRELAIQIDESFAAYGEFAGLRHTVIFGGVGQEPQTRALKRGIHILTATPGRLLDLLNQGFVDLSHLKVFVLDEADRMLDMGFIHDVRKVIARLPQRRQTLLFSATMPPEIVKLSKTILHNPKRVEVTPPSTTAETITQSIYFVERGDKRSLLIDLLRDEKIERALIFTRTKHGANKVARDLSKSNIPADAIHGNKSQNARQLALNNFKDKKIKALVATDIAARGIDVDDLALVINYEIPNIPETYVHRIGRTGRAGTSGTAVSFCDSEERAYLKDIEKLIGFSIPVAKKSDRPDVKETPGEQKPTRTESKQTNEPRERGENERERKSPGKSRNRNRNRNRRPNKEGGENKGSSENKNQQPQRDQQERARGEQKPRPQRQQRPQGDKPAQGQAQGERKNQPRGPKQGDSNRPKSNTGNRQDQGQKPRHERPQTQDGQGAGKKKRPQNRNRRGQHKPAEENLNFKVQAPEKKNWLDRLKDKFIR